MALGASSLSYSQSDQNLTLLAYERSQCKQVSMRFDIDEIAEYVNFPPFQ